MSLATTKSKIWEAGWKAQLSSCLDNDPHPELRIITPGSIHLTRKSARYVRYLYEHQEPVLAFNFYIQFIKKHALSADLKRIEEFQLLDMLMAILNQEVVWLRTRRGGKTRDLSLVAIFWAIIGKSVIWFTPQSDQQKQAIQYFLANPFYASSTRDEFYIHEGKTPIEMSNLTLGKSASKGKDCILYDEGAKVPKGYQIYDFYKFSRVIVSAKLWEGDKHILSASTAARNTAIEEEYDLLMKISPDLVSVHPYTDCWWISEEWVNQERMANLNDPWFVDQEYLTLFVNRGGSVFENIVQMSINDMQDLPITHIGADINKKEALSFWHIDDRTQSAYLLAEQEFDWTRDSHCFDFIQPCGTFMNKTIRLNFFENYVFEVEGMGYNEKEALWIASHIPNSFVNMEWDDTAKGDRVMQAKKMTLYMDPVHTPLMYQDFRNSVYHPYKGIYLKDAAHPMHWAESGLHAIGAKCGHFIAPQSTTAKVIELPHHRMSR